MDAPESVNSKRNASLRKNPPDETPTPQKCAEPIPAAIVSTPEPNATKTGVFSRETIAFAKLAMEMLRIWRRRDIISVKFGIVSALEG